jgi:hypothetical protein
MKRILKRTNFVALMLVALATTSCEDDYLSTPPADKLTSDGFYQTPGQSEQGVIGIYAGLRDLSRDEFLYMSEFRSDNIWVRPQPDGVRETSEISNFRAGPDLSYFNSTWNAWYKIIYNANIAIQKVAECDFGSNEALKNQLLGEARFLRGWAYFELVRLYGNVPIIDAPKSPNEVMNIGLSPANEVYDKMVIPDLKTAKELLPLDADMLDATGAKKPASGRADKIAAQAMLARAYMTMAGFPVNDAAAKALAKTELKAVVDFSEANGNKYWAPDSTEWRKQWISENNNKYSIFAIQHRSGGSGNSAIFETGASCPPSYTSIRVYETNALDVWVEKSLVYEFQKTYAGGNLDARGLGHSVLLGYDAEPNWPARAPQLEALYVGQSSEQVPANAIFYKYLNSKIKRSALGYTANIETGMTDYRDWPVNCPVIRYEDVLLMYAEVLAGEGVVGDASPNTTTALGIVNKIRARAGCDPVTAADGAVLELVKKERRLELFGEGVRWFDLVRWNDWKATITDRFNAYGNPAGSEVANIKDGRHLFPIPMNQLNVKPGLYKQNEGY